MYVAAGSELNVVSCSLCVLRQVLMKEKLVEYSDLNNTWKFVSKKSPADCNNIVQ